jgi:hypothetical protein
MRPIQRIISIGFATAAIAAASMPAMSWTVWPDVDFEWYANVGKTAAAQPAPLVSDEQNTVPVREPSASDSYAPTAPDTTDRALPASQPEGRTAQSLPDTELVSPTLPYSGSNRR